MKLTAVVVALAAAATLAAPAVASAGEDGGHGGHHNSGGGSRKGKHTTATTVPGAREIVVRAKSFEFSPDEITIGAGEEVTIALRSTDILHDFVVQREGHIVAAKGKKTKRGGLRIDEPGTYGFWCSVAGHRRAGMEGTIVVQ